MKRVLLLVAVTLAWSGQASGVVTDVQYDGTLHIMGKLMHIGPPYAFYTYQHYHETLPYVGSLADSAEEPGLLTLASAASQTASFAFAPNGELRSLGFQATASASVLALGAAHGLADGNSYLNMDFTVAGEPVQVCLSGTLDSASDWGYLEASVFLFRVLPGWYWPIVYGTNIYQTPRGPFEATVLLEPGQYQLAAGVGVRAEIAPGYIDVPLDWAKLDLTFTIVPEPTSLALLAAAGGLVLRRSISALGRTREGGGRSGLHSHSCP